MVTPYFTDVYLIPQPVKTLLTNPLFLYVTSKKEGTKHFHFHFTPTDGFLYDIVVWFGITCYDDSKRPQELRFNA